MFLISSYFDIIIDIIIMFWRFFNQCLTGEEKTERSINVSQIWQCPMIYDFIHNPQSVFPTLSVSELCRGTDLEIQGEFSFLTCDYNFWSSDLGLWSIFFCQRQTEVCKKQIPFCCNGFRNFKNIGNIVFPWSIILILVLWI